VSARTRRRCGAAAQSLKREAFANRVPELWVRV
jgi:hypothetical protein